jgi:putative glycosyltransferase (TIGR04372 family)
MKNFKKALSYSKDMPVTAIICFLIIPLVLIIRIIKPLIFIRFGSLNSIRMGHYFFDIEYYLNEKNNDNSKSYDFFYLGRTPPVNSYVEKLASRYIKINMAVKFFDYCNTVIPGGKKHKIDMATKLSRSRDVAGIFSDTQNIIRFNDEENKIGYSYLEKVGIQKNQRFHCLLVRESEYFKKALSESDMSYHDYRDSDVQRYIKSADWLNSQKKIKTIRMGKFVKNQISNQESIIDYATSKDRSDFLDLWLMANCFFCTSTTPGIEVVAVCFRKPLLLSSHLPYGDARTGNKRCIELFKYIKSKETQKFIGINEQIDLEIIDAKKIEQYNGFEIIDNTENEILSATQELIKLIEKNNIYDEDTDKLNKKFWKDISKWSDFYKFHGKINAKISPSFLKKNQSWLLSKN